MSLFSKITPMPLDPVVVSFEGFLGDPRPAKINLGVGMYYDAVGRIPLLDAVRKAEAVLAERGEAPWGYLPVEGTADFRGAVERLLYGDVAKTAAKRIVTLQAVGGTGALRLGADVLKALLPVSRVAVSDPSWANHPPLFEAAAFEMITYPYCDASGALDFAGMATALDRFPPGTIVVLHACCHNPTGIDPTPTQWRELTAQMASRRLVPLIDMAYQGFGEGIDADALPVRLLAEAGVPFFVAVSFSKSFSLYGERVGALSVMTESARDAELLTGLAKNAIRTLYSTPPTHGAALVSTILNTPDLEALWRSELDAMRERIKTMRRSLAERLPSNEAAGQVAAILAQHGLFSFSGLSPAQIARLRDEFAIHALENGRVCLAALNEGNLDRVADAISKILRESAAGR